MALSFIAVFTVAYLEELSSISGERESLQCSYCDDKSQKIYDVHCVIEVHFIGELATVDAP